MGQKTNPIGNRLGFIHGWESNWYGGDNYKEKLVEDDKIRKYLHARLSRASIAKIIIERTLKLVTVTINTARNLIYFLLDLFFVPFPYLFNTINDNGNMV